MWLIEQAEARLVFEIDVRLELAAKIGTTEGILQDWTYVHSNVPPKWALEIEKATNGEVSRRDLSPDIYPKKTEQSISLKYVSRYRPKKLTPCERNQARLEILEECYINPANERQRLRAKKEVINENPSNTV